MKIKSRFKDYYDYVAHAYGGGDERVMYVREPLSDDITVVDKGHDFYIPSFDTMKAQTKHLIINGKHYLLVAVADGAGGYGKFELFSKKNFEDRYDQIKTRYYSWNAGSKYVKWDDAFGKDSEVALRISQKIEQPVFIINDIIWDYKKREYRYVIDKNIPILLEYGINHYIQPEQLYQDIAYFTSNKMVTSPDLVVNDNMTDKEKILQHGFDVKQSFRHRK